MKITHFEPWSFVSQLHRDLDRFAAAGIDNKVGHDPASEWMPAVDIIDEKERFLLRADVPGVAPADIDVSMDARVLTVSGVRHVDAREDDAATQRVERSTGRFSRRFTLPETADAEGITASNSNGVLEVAIPKHAEIQARRIAVEAA